MTKDSKGHGSNKKSGSGFASERAKQMKALAHTATDVGIDPRTGRPRVKKFKERSSYGNKK